MKVLQVGDEVWSVYARENNFLGYYMGGAHTYEPWAMLVNTRCHVKLVKLMGPTWFEAVGKYQIE